jgi:hypothetical protein
LEERPVVDPTDDEEPRGKTDAVAIFYILAGIPAMWLFMVVLFVATMIWDIPA